jgi:hypothetical protein
MFQVQCQVDVGDYTFQNVESIEVRSSWEDLTDTATVRVPRQFRLQGKQIAQGESLFRRGDAIQIKTGWDGTLYTLLNGYLSGIKPNESIEFTAEDGMWQLKQKIVNRSYTSVSLQQLLSDLAPSLNPDAQDIELGKLRLSNVTAAQVLDKLKKDMGIYTYLREGRLYSGMPYRLGAGATHIFRIGENVVSADRLEFKRADDVKVKVEAVSILANNTKIEKTFGDPDGSLRRLYFYGLPESALKTAAEAELARYQAAGYTGTIEAFGKPRVQHGDVARIEDSKNPDRNGDYLIKRVTTTSGLDGWFQSIELDRKVS